MSDIAVVQEIYSFIGQIALQLGGVVIISYSLIKYAVHKWVENKLSLNLERYKADQAKELESLRSKINLLLERTLKLHEKEYEVFPAVWEKLIDACFSLERCVSGYKTIPDFIRMNDEELHKFLNRSDLSDDEKDYFSTKENKISAYADILNWRDIKIAHESFMAFHGYLQKNRIFLSHEIKEELVKIDYLMWKVWVRKKK